MLVGLAFIALLGWRLVPERSAGTGLAETFELDKYLTEARVPGTDAKAHGMTLGELEREADRYDAVVAGVIRRDERLSLTRKTSRLQTRDVVLIEADPEGLDALMDALDLKPIGERSRGKARSRFLQSEDIALTEAVVEPDARAAGRTLEQLQPRRRFGVVVLGVSRQGRARSSRMRKMRLRVGDVLLLHGERDRVGEALDELQLLPLRERGHTFGRRTGAPWVIGIFGVAVGVASLGYVSVPVALGAAVALIVLLGLMPLAEVYEAVDWPVIVLLGALIPIGGALESTGATVLIADGLTRVTADLPAVAVLALLMIITMSLSDILNNAATAVIMAPVAVDLGERMGANPDGLLMSVAVGASCAFLTPVGHQNNALVFGPGGYRFGDYWRMGLPLEILIVAVAAPMILLVWPLRA
jgi:di/tricarboxylate transporter